MEFSCLDSTLSDLFFRALSQVFSLPNHQKNTTTNTTTINTTTTTNTTTNTTMSLPSESTTPQCPFGFRQGWGKGEERERKRRKREEKQREEQEGREERIRILLERQKVTTPVLFLKGEGEVVHSEGTRALLEDVGRENIIEATDRFYQKAFIDKHIDPFIRDHNDPHGERLGLWIIEEMGAGPVWTDTRPPNARAIAHEDARTSPKREKKDIGKAFTLNDCRNWMRLFFWGYREQGLDAHKPFWDWLINFIAHFIGVYEETSPPYTKEDSMWSLDTKKIEKYKKDGYFMEDIHGNEEEKLENLQKTLKKKEEEIINPQTQNVEETKKKRKRE